MSGKDVVILDLEQMPEDRFLFMLDLKDVILSSYDGDDEIYLYDDVFCQWPSVHSIE